MLGTKSIQTVLEGFLQKMGPWLGSLNGFHDNIISGKSLDCELNISPPPSSGYFHQQKSRQGLTWLLSTT